MASDGYPEAYKSGYEIKVDENIDACVYIAGAKNIDGKLLSAGGRVLGVTATAPTLEGAVDKAYSEIKKVSFDNMYYRHDLGKKALDALR